MPQPTTILAMFPGMFDPVTYGHLDIIQLASALYERLIVAVGHNPLKTEVFTPEERKDMLIKHTCHLPNVEVRTYSGLTVEFARGIGARVILRGIRDTGWRLEHNANRRLALEVLKMDLHGKR